MDMTGEYRIPAPRQTVWEALNDPEVLKACIPGCEALNRVSDNEMNATVVTRIGPVKATFQGNVRFSNVDPPAGYTISGEGKGGAAGFAKGGADVALREEGDGTVLTYTAKAQVGGKLAQLGSRLIDSTAKKMADEFFSAFAARLGGGEMLNAPAGVPVQHPEPDAPVVEDKAEEATAFAEAAEERIEVAAGRGFLGGPYVWGLLALIVVILLLAWMTWPRSP